MLCVQQVRGRTGHGGGHCRVEQHPCQARGSLQHRLGSSNSVGGCYGRYAPRSCARGVDAFVRCDTERPVICSASCCTCDSRAISTGDNVGPNGLAGSFAMNITIPPGAQAAIHIPKLGGDATRVSESGHTVYGGATLESTTPHVSHIFVLAQSCVCNYGCTSNKHV